jgi:hypothetical protein
VVVATEVVLPLGGGGAGFEPLEQAVAAPIPSPPSRPRKCRRSRLIVAT